MLSRSMRYNLPSLLQPTPLARFTAGCNYPVRNDKLMPLQRLANGFLYDYLIPTFGESW